MDEEFLLHVVLFQPEIPQNTGNIGRTCVAAGAKLWLVQPLGFRLDHVHLRRAGMDYWEHLQYELLADWQAVTSRFPRERLWLFTKFGKKLYSSAHFRCGDVLVFGNESSGLPASVRQSLEDRTLFIPMRPAARSLNLACAVAVGVYEALRQLQYRSADNGAQFQSS
jgi:tRNA (cytidine/uridine-2'-O-)-methyltransferase